MTAEQQASCPNCGKTLTKVPTRKSACPHCHRDIYVRTKQDLYPTSLLTEQQANIVDELSAIEYMGIGVTEFVKLKERLSKNFGQAASDDDTMWSAYHSLLNDFARQGDQWQIAHIYNSMAVFLVRRGKSGKDMQVEASKAMMRSFLETGVSEFEITTYEPCDACRKLENKKFRMTEAFVEKPLLPPDGCDCRLLDEKHAFCNCLYVSTAYMR